MNFTKHFIMPLPPDSVGEGTIISDCSVRHVRSFVPSFVRKDILLARYLMNSLNYLAVTDSEYSIFPADDLISFWRSEVKSQAYRMPSRWRKHPCRRWGVEVHLRVKTQVSK